MKKILVVCHGNINRSPLCAAVLRRALPNTFSVRGAGFVNPNRRASKKMRDAAAGKGYDLEPHRSQLATTELLSWADLIIYMDNGNLRRLGNLVGLEGRCLAQFCSPAERRIPDPAFMKKDSAEFSAVVDQIVLSSLALARWLEKQGDGDGTGTLHTNTRD